MNKYWAVVISVEGIRRMWLSNHEAISLLKRQSIPVTRIYRDEQEAVLLHDGEMVWKDVPILEYTDATFSIS